MLLMEQNGPHGGEVCVVDWDGWDWWLSMVDCIYCVPKVLPYRENNIVVLLTKIPNTGDTESLDRCG